ncbi:kinase-like domain-containing protein [Dioszegia hungarica]|uniref:cyclin-dependent kinase n=1 Tax=Dioszegia hungarica TaxID=4972 RepID=A0AA38GZX4_9TREE|nr:kinase-like domain-containing protein [Dioszegia hungarica]KAI9632088.1 kinase-like domain-containing protein [Dioszegia hungarica]
MATSGSTPPHIQPEAGPSARSPAQRNSVAGPSSPQLAEEGSSVIKRRAVKSRKIRRPDDVSLGVDAEEPSQGDVAPQRNGGAAGPSRSRSASPSRRSVPTRPISPAVRRSASPEKPDKRIAEPAERTRPPAPPPRFARRSHLAPSRSSHPPLLPCRSVYSYTRLNHIEEGTYGVVFRARCNDTNQIFALKKLKLEEEKQGFPITSLREIMALMVAGEHPNVVGIREIVVGETLNQIFIVMPFIEHDLKTLLTDMPHPFLQSEIKTLMIQLLSGVAYCHANWILHRDLKTSNLLLTNRGQLRIADFGLARKFGDPLPPMTQLVVTLWYRAPELLLGAKEYSTAVDLWSVGCIFGELLGGEAMMQGRGEIDQIGKIFMLLGQPNEDVWPGYNSLPLVKNLNPIGPPFSVLRQRFKQLTSSGHNLLAGLLMYDPARRLSADEAGKHPYFEETPLPKHPDLFASFPSVAAGERRHRLLKSPLAPVNAHRVEDDGMDLESFV